MSSDQHGHMFPMSEMRSKDDNAKKTNTRMKIKIQRQREIIDKKAQFASLSSDQHDHMFPMSEMRSKTDNAKKTKGK